MKKQIMLLLALSIAVVAVSWAQTTFPYNGIKDQREGWYAITHATLVSGADATINNATMVIKNGRIISITAGGAVPAGAIEIDATGKFVYPSFIDMYAEYGLPEASPVGKRPEQQPQMLSNKPGAYAWNEALKPEFRAADHFKPDSKGAANWRAMGFGTVATHQQDGISRGASAIVTLGDQSAHQQILKEEAAHYLSFRKGVSTQNYPTSLMGIIALLRQTYLDGQWYDQQEEETNFSLAAWNKLQQLPQVFVVGDWQEGLRAQKIGEEFDQDYIIKGTGDEYQRLDAFKEGTRFIVPLTFPKTQDLSDPYGAQQVSLTDLRHWEMAPANAASLSKAGISFALTASGHEKAKDFFSALQKAIQNGLSEEEALRALTTIPAEMLGIAEQVGSLEEGKRANFIITSAPVFEQGASIHHNWVQGKAYMTAGQPASDVTGKYRLLAGDRAFNMMIRKNGGKVIVDEDTKLELKYEHKQGQVQLHFPVSEGGSFIRLSGITEDGKWSGRGQDEKGNWISWEAERTGPLPSKEEEAANGQGSKDVGMLSSVSYPFGAYGWTEKPATQTVVIRGATLWTNEEEGVIKQGDIMLQDGKIAAIGDDVKAPKGVIEIDGSSMHVTPGIIDEHTHIAVSRGVNESSQESTAEVRIGDVIDATDIDIYRQLSGGVTSAQVLHGSANPIGGQSAIIKMRWGYTPEEMKFEGAPGFIKFALGENVKQSNRSRNYRSRYPQTRMGVEQVFENYFTEARQYGDAVKAGEQLRRDLELETLLEILESERFISCHSYQQGEINMLMKVAERFGFRINTFTHILEGYKVADKMAEHGAGGSSFSDWWAYKFEVIEAIPHNGALMHEEGVTVAFNSDDAEMARRLNQEAAKAVLFGGVSEEDALKFVTLNPAKLLHIDDQVGSLKVGKDADIVLWTANPLSVYARVQQTYIDGIKFFDLETDEQLRAELAEERNALIQKMMQSGPSSGEARQSGRRGKRHYHCDTLHDEAQ